MKLIKKDLKHGVIIVEIVSLDDLWYVSQVVDAHDVVKGKTSRKVKLGEDTSKVVKKTYTLEIETEKLEFGMECLRVLGKVVSETEDIPKGSYQSITIEIGSIITIIKKEWLQFQVDRIEEATRDIPKVLLVVADRGEAAFGVLRQFGVETLSEISGAVAKKLMSEDIREDFFGLIAKEIVDYDNRLTPEYIVVGSPAFWKDEILKRVEKINPKVSKKMVLATTSSVGKSGLQELVSRDEVRKVLQQERVIREAKVVEEVLKEIQKDGPVAYGMKAVESAAMAGAVKELIVAEELLRKSREENTFEPLELIMKTVEQTKGSVMIISSEHDAGKQLSGLGGIAALLRYKL